MSTTTKLTKLVAQLIITGEIELLTGLRIGGSETGLSIGGVDTVVIRNATDGKPYIPGSSLKGKMRCLLEKVYCPGKLSDVANSRIFTCDSLETYNNPKKGIIFHLFGTTNEEIKKLKNDGNTYLIDYSLPTRLIVRDCSLTNDSAKKLEESLYVDLPYTQAKTEVVIDRITSAATPRKIERVPAGVKFNYQIVLNIYDPPDLKDEWLSSSLNTLKEGMDLLENDYLGGMGSRGYGQIKFATRKVKLNNLTEDTNLEQNMIYTQWLNTFQR
ncbi:MAG TPA: type III-A CRISPR-associated RAMP protein Csm3 [Candidatus Hydrogenedens sp.]|nr:type III-A CRISPR-associated RAMP protein Csm3 [Candidatus Hydrogenedens sp.]HOL20851.1 type III-A CRISPR-associated RAMP protein Csm3 [Candidatus Hydrogenedens sp.]